MGDEQKNHQKKTERGRPGPLHSCRTNKKRRRRRNITDQGPRTVTKSPPNDSRRKNTEGEAEGTKERNGKKVEPTRAVWLSLLQMQRIENRPHETNEPGESSTHHETRGREAKNIQRTRTTKKNHEKKRPTKPTGGQGRQKEKTNRKTTRPRT